jgi:hypothetical protein
MIGGRMPTDAEQGKPDSFMLKTYFSRRTWNASSLMNHINDKEFMNTYHKLLDEHPFYKEMSFDFVESKVYDKIRELKNKK